MILTVLPPCYFPPVDLCARAMASDVVVWADTFPFKKGSTMNRTRIKTAAGPMWLTIPVHRRGSERPRFAEVCIDNHEPWRANHRKNIEHHYRNSPYFFFLSDEVGDLLAMEWCRLDDLCLQSTEIVFRKLGLVPRIVRGSELPTVADRTERVMTWLQETRCDTYLVEERDASLIDAERILGNGFRILTFHYEPVPYHQQFNIFIPFLSSLDLLFNEGDMGREILKKGANLNPYSPTGAR